MRNKLIAALIGLALLLGGGTAGADERQDNIKSKVPVAPKKCWKRISWISSTTSMGNGKRAPIYERSDLPACKAFEEVLNTTCESPKKLKCDWLLPAGEKKFKKLTWKQVDFKEHKGFIEDMILGKDHAQERWNTKDPKFKKAFEENRIDIKMTLIDIDGDGARESLVRQNWRVECPASAEFGVMDPEQSSLTGAMSMLLVISMQWKVLKSCSTTAKFTCSDGMMLRRS